MPDIREALFLATLIDIMLTEAFSKKEDKDPIYEVKRNENKRSYPSAHTLDLNDITVEFNEE